MVVAPDFDSEVSGSLVRPWVTKMNTVEANVVSFGDAWTSDNDMKKAAWDLQEESGENETEDYGSRQKGKLSMMSQASRPCSYASDKLDGCQWNRYRGCFLNPQLSPRFGIFIKMGWGFLNLVYLPSSSSQRMAAGMRPWRGLAIRMRSCDISVINGWLELIDDEIYKKCCQVHRRIVSTQFLLYFVSLRFLAPLTDNIVFSFVSSSFELPAFVCISCIVLLFPCRGICSIHCVKLHRQPWYAMA